MARRAARSMCSGGWPNPRSVASERAMNTSVSRTPESATDGEVTWGERPMTAPDGVRTVGTTYRQSDQKETPMPKFLIERTVPGAGQMDEAALAAISAKSNGVLHDLGPDIQWVHSYVTDDKI